MSKFTLIKLLPVVACLYSSGCLPIAETEGNAGVSIESNSIVYTSTPVNPNIIPVMSDTFNFCSLVIDSVIRLGLWADSLTPLKRWNGTMEIYPAYQIPLDTVAFHYYQIPDTASSHIIRGWKGHLKTLFDESVVAKTTDLNELPFNIYIKPLKMSRDCGFLKGLTLEFKTGLINGSDSFKTKVQLKAKSQRFSGRLVPADESAGQLLVNSYLLFIQGSPLSFFLKAHERNISWKEVPNIKFNLFAIRFNHKKLSEGQSAALFAIRTALAQDNNTLNFLPDSIGVFTLSENDVTKLKRRKEDEK